MGGVWGELVSEYRPLSRTVFEVADATGARTRYLTHAARYAETPATFRRVPPRAGEHADEVLREVGFSDAELLALREASALG